MTNPLHLAARAIMLRALRGWDAGTLDVWLPNGARRTFGPIDSPRRVTMRVNDDRFFWRLLLGGSTGVGESYMHGEWESDDLPAVLREALRNASRVNFDSVASLPVSVVNLLKHRRRANTERGSERNIHAHYDLGNEFFRLFLDETLTYSCAYWTDAADLHAAQIRKYDLIIQKLAIGPDDHVLEIGSGWGGFAIHAAHSTGCRVTGITISREQFELSRRRVREARLRDRIDIRYRDYRDIEGPFDKLVSIEMFEAVGREYWQAFFEACARALRPGGAMLLQTIAIPDDGAGNRLRSSGWISKYIFPGGVLPAVIEIEASVRAAGASLEIRRLEDISPHYVRTLDAWRGAFWNAIDDVRAQGFDEVFIRMWDFYLASCSAAFAAGHVRDVQMLFEKVGVAAPDSDAPIGAAAPA